MNFVALDVETTGFSEKYNEIIEIGIVEFEDGKIINEYNTLIKPKKPITPEITAVNGITNEMVENAPSLEEVQNEIHYRIIGKTLVMHNAPFDKRFVSAAVGYPLTNEIIDTLSLARKAKLGLENNKLGTVATHFGIVNENAHRASDDAKCCGEIYLKMLEEI